MKTLESFSPEVVAAAFPDQPGEAVEALAQTIAQLSGQQILVVAYVGDAELSDTAFESLVWLRERLWEQGCQAVCLALRGPARIEVFRVGEDDPFARLRVQVVERLRQAEESVVRTGIAGGVERGKLICGRAHDRARGEVLAYRSVLDMLGTVPGEESRNA